MTSLPASALYRLAFAALMVAVVVAVAACGGSDSSSSTVASGEPMTVPAQPAEVKVALDWTPNTNHIGIYVAQELGYYKDQDLTVKLLPYASTSPERLVSSGEAQFGFSYSNGIAFARAAGLDVVQVFASISKQQYLLAYRADDPSITTPKDLDGKTYAGFGTPSEESEVATVIKGDGGKGDFKKVVLDAAAYEAVYSGRADFTISASTWEGVEAEVNGKPMKYFDPADYGYPDNYSNTIIASNAWLTANPDVAKRFLAATQQGYQYAADNPAEAAQLLLDAPLPLTTRLALAGQLGLVVQDGGGRIPDIGEVFANAPTDPQELAAWNTLQADLQHAIREAGTAAAAWPFLAAGGLVLLALVPIAIGRRHLDL